MFIGPQNIQNLVYISTIDPTNPTFKETDEKVKCSGVQVSLSSCLFPFLSSPSPFSNLIKNLKRAQLRIPRPHTGHHCSPVILLSSGAFISKTLMTLCHILLKRRGKTAIKGCVHYNQWLLKNVCSQAVMYLWDFFQSLSLLAAS